MNDNKSEKIKLNNEILKSMFYDIRDEKVMSDFDLAVIFGFDNKRFNEQVKNNVEKFEDDFIF